MPLPTPDAQTGLITRSFTIPADLSIYLTGAIWELAQVNGWVQVGNRTPQECAQVFMDIIDNEE